jgi:NlpB/DapX lipoprotein
VIKSRILALLLVSCFLAGCASDDSRYRDNANLERPPAMTLDKQAVEQAAANALEEPIRRRGKGLKSDVAISDGAPKELRIKRTFDEAWSLLNQAIQHNELKITDQDRSKGVYYVGYSGGGFFSTESTFFDFAKDKPTYLLKVEQQGEETRVTASLANKDEQTAPRDSEEDPDKETPELPQDKSSNLIELLHDTLHDDLKDE